MTTADKIRVMQAHMEGKPIEVRPVTMGREWSPAPDPVWNWLDNTYRVKPEPREFWLVSGRPGCMPIAARTKGAARELQVASGDEEIIHVREVLE